MEGIVKRLYGAMPYLLLVSFYSGNIGSFTPEMATEINRSPYHGVAIPVVHYTDSSRNVDVHASITRLSHHIKKDIWPWIFFNRFCGFDGKKPIPPGKEMLFARVKGMDLYNEAGALEDFFDTWKLALKAARSIGSPGIFVDPEPYNCWDVNYLAHVARQRSEPKDAIRERLIQIGETLADMTAVTYPNAILWFPFSAATAPIRRLPWQHDEFWTTTYIVLGMLERAVKEHYTFKIISGAEVSLGYCFRDAPHLAEKIESRAAKFKPLLGKYPNLRLGGTVSPWHAQGLKTDWMLKGECGTSALKTIDDFRPVFKSLFMSYDYVWIYAAGAASYDPYHTEIASLYNKAIDDALREAGRHGLTHAVSPASMPVDRLPQSSGSH